MKAKVKVFCRFQHDWNVQEIEKIEKYFEENLQYIKQNDFVEIKERYVMLKIEKIVHTISNNPIVEVFLLLH